MKHWLDPAATVIQSETNDLKELAKLSGSDPRHFYVGTHLDGVNICGQDLRGLDFTGLKSAAVLFDNLTKLDNRYWRQLNDNPNAVRVLSQGRDIVDQFEALQPTAGELISEIVQEKYAADRAARIFRAALDDRYLGFLVAANYPTDKSITEQGVIEALSNAIKKYGASDDATFNIHVVRAIEDCLRRTFYQNRTNLLVALIFHLGDVPAVRPFLITRVKRRHYLLEHKDITEKLGLPNSTNR